MNKIALKRSIVTMANQKKYMRGRSRNVLIRGARVIAFVASRVLFSRNMLVKINDLGRNMEYDAAEYVGSFVDATYGEREIYRRDYFGKGVEKKFENITVMVPERFHEVLTNMYGDYLQLPPKEKQIPLHEYIAYYNI